MRTIEVMTKGQTLSINCDQILCVWRSPDESKVALIVFTNDRVRNMVTDTPYNQVVQMWREA